MAVSSSIHVSSVFIRGKKYTHTVSAEMRIAGERSDAERLSFGSFA
jgi:hypothetical protein